MITWALESVLSSSICKYENTNTSYISRHQNTNSLVYEFSLESWIVGRKIDAKDLSSRPLSLSHRDAGKCGSETGCGDASWISSDMAKHHLDRVPIWICFWKASSGWGCWLNTTHTHRIYLVQYLFYATVCNLSIDIGAPLEAGILFAGADRQMC